MAWSSGSFTRTNGTNTGSTLWASDRDDGTKITAARHDTHDQDLADGINATVNKDGSNTYATSSGTDTITLTLTPAPSSYNAGMIIAFKAGGTNTGAATININSLGAKTIQALGAGISANDITTNDVVELRYDGTQFQMISPVRSNGGGIASVVADTSPQLGGFLDANGNYIQTEKGGDIASASPLVVDTDGDYFDVTGTIGFTAMTVAADRQFTLQFDGVLTMTHHATNLDLPGEANITTAAGDVAVFQSTGTNTVQCISYTRADGTAITGISNVVEDTSPQLGGALDPNGQFIGMDKGGDIASASPLVVDTDGDYFDVTGTTGFSAMTVAANRHFFLQFDGALTMTHHTTNLDLPGEANITTAAGDVAEFFSTGTNTVQCVNYTKADGTAVVTSGGIDVQEFSASGTWTKPSSGARVLVEIWGGGGGGGQHDTSNGSGGGGGGGYNFEWMDIGDLAATEAVTIGSGGSAGAEGVGGNGGNSTVDTVAGSVVAYGGGGGGFTSDNTGGSGSGGGGQTSAGAAASGAVAGAGGTGMTSSFSGGAAGSSSAGGDTTDGTGGGGGGGDKQGVGQEHRGGNSFYGGGGGGSGGGDGSTDGGAGGHSVYGGGGGGGAVEASSGRTAGSGGTSRFGGAGGAGSGSGGGAGTAGSVPGGGGGGSDTGTSGGAGGGGKARITTF